MFEWTTQALSNRQFSLLRECQVRGGLGIERVLELSQTTAGSVVRRGFLRWDAALGHFVLSELGLETMKRFEHSDIGRHSIDRPFSKFILDRNKQLGRLSEEYLRRNHEIVKSQKEDRKEAPEERRKRKDAKRKAMK